MSAWRQYLEVAPFVIRTDHQSLKFLLEQRLHTTLQQKGIAKLLGLQYTIQYKKGIENRVADALSRKGEEGNSGLLAISAIIPT